jgi:hypothetical protein
MVASSAAINVTSIKPAKTTASFRPCNSCGSGTLAPCQVSRADHLAH